MGSYIDCDTHKQYQSIVVQIFWTENDAATRFDTRIDIIKSWKLPSLRYIKLARCVLAIALIHSYLKHVTLHQKYLLLEISPNKIS